MFVGRRIVSTYHTTAPGCGGKGVGGIVVHDKAEEIRANARRIYIVYDNCMCNKPYGGGCNGYSYNIEDKTCPQFKWAESDNSEQSCSNEELCNCAFDIIMAFGCQCGGK